MSEKTKGSQTSSFPGSLPNFEEQSELLDPAVSDSTLAEGRDANLWSAEIEAIASTLGTGGRGEVSVSSLSATIEGLSYVYQGTRKEYAGETGRSLQPVQTSRLWLNPRTNAVEVSTSGWPSYPHIRLASHNAISGTTTDERPHTLEKSAEYPVLSNSSGKTMVSGSAEIPEGGTQISFSYGITFSSVPVVAIGVRLSADGIARYANLASVTTTGAVAVSNSAAPVGGTSVDWIAVGEEDHSESGSGS